MFDTQFKTILLHELKILKSKRFISYRIFNISLVTILAFLFCSAFSKVPQDIPLEEAERMIRVLFQFLLVCISAAFIFFSPTKYFNEFKKEKSDKIYEVMLTSPISLLKFVVSKLISIFLIDYIILWVCFTGTFIVLSMYHFSPFSIISFEAGLMVLVIMPLYMILHLSFGLWAILRFKNAMIHFLILILLLLPFVLEGSMHLLGRSLFKPMFKWIGDSFITGNLISLPILIFSLLGLLIGFFIMFIVMKRFNKERIIS
ncbi:MAG: hypothetical protein LBC39_08755 [Methanobrevibacter sp.]|jgi:ABC-type transport system involved in multi-copper enzyme maturation permease subunit|nr:hypothetical protein [Candidatus Methanovirga aequatorialis]